LVFSMMDGAKRNRELIADLEPQASWLRMTCSLDRNQAARMDGMAFTSTRCCACQRS
jgi:hypothetical protein